MQDQYQNPFDNSDYSFLVLKNNLGQISLWPEFKHIPAGWQAIYGPGSRSQCINFIEQDQA
ncbi:MbtH family protein [Catenovulum agarivorans]|uniref:MbtH family protein n=1 Tax=Catenovulum agarivorans TaxID=1172192 RepID=UPI0002F8989C|nr:MbtH family protein [Catenovulum agarivorans]